MKINFNILLLFMVLAVGTVMSCSSDDSMEVPDEMEDPCMSVDCGMGSCDNGTCVCPENFTGENCESCIEGYEGSDCLTEIRAKFYGAYDIVTDNCTGGVTLDANFAEISGNVDSIFLLDILIAEEFDGSTFNEVEFIGTFSGDTLRVSGEDVFFEHEIFGIRNMDGQIEGTYNLKSSFLEIDAECELLMQPR